MKSRDEIRLVLSKRQLKGFMFLALMVGGAYALMSESFTLSTYYPAPSGVYDKMITTNATYLARDDGNVGIGTTNPGARLEVAGGIRLSGATTTYAITNVADPVAATDVATKAYVDAASSGSGGSPAKWNCKIESASQTCGYWGGCVSSITALCKGSAKVISGGCGINDTATRPITGQGPAPGGQGWTCYGNPGYNGASPGIITAYANCCD